MYRYLFESLLSLPLGSYPEVELQVLSLILLSVFNASSFPFFP